MATDTEGRRDASRQVLTRWNNRVRVDAPGMEHLDPTRSTTAGKVDPTKHDLRRARKTKHHADPERVDAFKAETPKRLNDEGKRNRSMELPAYRHPSALKPEILPFLVDRGTLWRTKEELHLSWCDDPQMPTLGWSMAQKPNGHPALQVPQGAFITYAGTRRIDARVLGDRDATVMVARCVQAVFIYGQHRCVVWDFNVVEPIPDEDDEDDAENEEDR